MIRQRPRKGAVPRMIARRFAALFLLVCLCAVSVLCACGTDDPGVLPAPSVSEREESAFSGPDAGSGDAFPQESSEPGGHYESDPEPSVSAETSESDEPSGTDGRSEDEGPSGSGESSAPPSGDVSDHPESAGSGESGPDAGNAESPDGMSSSPSDSVSEDGSETGKTDPPVVREKRIITFSTVNDLHGHIEQDANGRNGIANTAYGIDSLSAFFGDDDPETDVRDDVVLFANGDMFQGTSVSNRTNGLAVVQAMNLMRFDAMGLGNHEFDWMLDSVLVYWDGDRSNGEANFPLVSANVQKRSAGGKLIADLSDKDGIAEFVLIEKMGIKIGLIGVIGQLKNSILQTAVADYDFADVTDAVYRAAGELKRRGAELICVSIHDGSDAGVLSYQNNVDIAHMKDGNGEYLVDVIFNGHTHTMQKGEISRPGGTRVPVVQAGGNNQGYGYVRLEYDPENGETSVVSYGCLQVSDLGAKADREVGEFVRRFADDLKSQDDVLAVSGVQLRSKYDYADYVGQIMIKAFGVDYAIGNFGGIRGTGGVGYGTKITLSNVYEMIPFDNRVYVVTIPGSALYDFWKDNDSYYYFSRDGEVAPVSALKNSSNIYTLAIIDYVYTGSYFSRARNSVRKETYTEYILRDLLAEDIRCFGRDGDRWDPDGGPRLARVSVR